MDFNFDFGGFDLNDSASENTGDAELTTANAGFGADDWGQTLESFFETPTKKKAKPEAKKTEQKKAAPKSSGKGGKDVEVDLPVKILARGFETVIEGSGMMKLSEIGKKLIEDGYNQFQIPGMALLYEEAVKTVYVVDGSVRAAEKDTAVDLTDGKTITVIDGQLTATFSAEDFDEKDVEEITTEDVAERFARVNPQYGGCKISFHPGCEFCYPVFDSYEFKDVKHPAEVMLGGAICEYPEDKIVDVKTLKEVVYGTLPKGLTVNLGKTSGAAAEDVLMTCFTCYNAYSVTEVPVASSKEKPKKVEQKYELPLELYIVTFNCLYTLKPEDFEGKDKVTLDEIKQYMADKQKMFADKSRKLDTLYNKEMNRLAVMFVSGSKGCEMIRTEDELIQCKAKEQFHGFYVGKQGVLKLLALPHGNFISHMGREELCTTVINISFERKLPKIPGKLLHDIIEYFREDLSNEAMVRIVYNKGKREFSFYKAGGSRSKVRLDYEFSVDESLFNPAMVQVMEIHSHNTMPAFFSPTDDADERDYPGVFGVIGNLDKQVPSIRFRAGVDGKFEELEVSELFEC